jgi:hypothetical protein
LEVWSKANVLGEPLWPAWVGMRIPEPSRTVWAKSPWEHTDRWMKNRKLARQMKEWGGPEVKPEEIPLWKWAEGRWIFLRFLWSRFKKRRKSRPYFQNLW